MPRGVYLSDENVRRVVRAYEAGDLSAKEIANQLNIAERTVYRIVKRHNLPLRPGGQNHGSTRRAS